VQHLLIGHPGSNSIPPRRRSTGKGSNAIQATPPAPVVGGCSQGPAIAQCGRLTGPRLANGLDPPKPQLGKRHLARPSRRAIRQEIHPRHLHGKSPVSTANLPSAIQNWPRRSSLIDLNSGQRGALPRPARARSGSLGCWGFVGAITPCQGRLLSSGSPDCPSPQRGPDPRRQSPLLRCPHQLSPPGKPACHRRHRSIGLDQPPSKLQPGPQP